MSDSKKLTKEERDRIVLNTWEQELRKGEGKRFFIFDCNNGVLDKEFNEKLRNFLQDAIKNYDLPETKLFKVTLRADNNRSLPERTEYLRCKDKETIRESMISACSAITSEYYGYTDVHIKEITVESIPEIMSMSIKIKNVK